METTVDILLIEDDEVDRASFERTLRKTGLKYRLRSAATAAAAMEALAAQPTDCIFVDYQLPGVDGLSLIGKIRAAGYDVPISVLTSQGDQHVAVEMMKAGAFDYVKKSEITPDRIALLVNTGARIKQVEDERRRYLAALRESRAQLMEAQLLARVSSYEYSIKTRIVQLSDSFYELFGISQATTIHGEMLRQFIYPEDLPETLERFYACIEQGVDFRHDFRARFPNGKIYYFTGTGRRKLDGEGLPMVIVGTVQDVTEQKLTENMIRENESLLKSINHNIKEGIYRSTPHNGLVYANQAFAQMFGYDSPEEILKVGIDSLYADPSMRRQFLKELESTGTTNSDEVLFVRKDGGYFWGLIRSIMSKDTYGNVFYDGAIVDISERKRAEVELKKAKEAAEAAAVAKSEFLSNMSHEIRTPMNAIIGLTDLLLNEPFEGKNLENLKAIKFSADNLLVIINDILDFSKIEAGKINFERINFNIENMMRDLVYSQQLRARAKGIELNLEMGVDIPPYLLGDPYRLNQVLLNLTSNAIKFTSVGQVDIVVHKIYEDVSGVGLSIAVVDTGIGIPQSKINAIFESFTQAYTDTTRKYGGTGLGLAITKRLVELQGGSILVKSREGVGSEFTVIMKFELGVEEKPQDRKEEDVVEKNLGGRHVLVAEDNVMNQFVIQKLLSKWNARVTITENGNEALHVLESEPVDLVLMDLQMPEMNGYDATEIIRDPASLVLDHSVPVIALTADAFSETRKRVLDSGFDDFVTKPFDQDALFSKLRKYLVRSSVSDNQFKGGADMEEDKREGLVDLSYFKDVIGDDDEMLRELLTMFLDQNPKEISDVKSMFAAGSFEDVKRVAHKMKSSLGTLGMKSTVHVLALIEKEALDRNTERVRELIDIVDQACDQARDEIMAIIARIDARKS